MNRKHGTCFIFIVAVRISDAYISNAYSNISFPTSDVMKCDAKHRVIVVHYVHTGTSLYLNVVHIDGAAHQSLLNKQAVHHAFYNTLLTLHKRMRGFESTVH